MKRQSRAAAAAARAAAAKMAAASALNLSSPEQSDTEMPDADTSLNEVEPPAGTNGDNAEDDEEEEAYAEPEDEAPEDGDASAEEASPEPEESAPPSPEPVPEKRKRGRPPRPKPPPDLDGSNDAADDSGITATPVKRKRGRPPSSAKGKKGGPMITQHAIDKAGTTVDVINDEAELPEDPEGEEKVDKLGNLQGGRDYRCRTFTVLGRGNRLYMLSTEPARCIGFRDSYLFFTKHRLLYKVIIDDAEKFDLIDRDIIPHSYKGRTIGLVTARSVFREFGARIIVGGKRIIDDYEVTKARADGIVEGELADPLDKMPKPGEPYDKNQYVAWHGASAVYHQNVPSVPLANIADPKKRKVLVTDTNWMLEHAKEASRFNSILTSARRDTLQGVYDVHTNIMQYPAIMQPTHARWERLPTPPLSADGDDSNGNDNEERSEIFPPPTEAQLKNRLIVDIVYEEPAYLSSDPGLRSTDEYSTAPRRQDELDIGSRRLADVPEDVVALLPPECAAAFLDAKRDEISWAGRFRTEAEDSGRAKLRIGLEPKFVN